MAGDASWEESYPIAYFHREIAVLKPMPPGDRDSSDQEEDTLISLDAILPDDLLEKVLSFLPIASIVRSSSVCKRWYEAVHSGRPSWAKMSPQKPWYFMFTCSDDAVSGYAYDPSLRKWYSFDFPWIEKSNWLTSSSCGLVCVMDGEDRSRIFVCNPVTRDWKRLGDAPGGCSPDYCALAVSVDRRTHGYTVAVAKCKQVPQDYYQWDFSIHIYESATSSWVTLFTQVLAGWRSGDECVICNGVLYLLIYSTSVLRNVESRHCLVMYDLAPRPSSSGTSLMQMAIPAPCSLTCGRLMNLGDRLVMVGGIGKHDRPGIIKGIGIWELEKKEWWEVARMPHKFFQGFGEFDDVFASSGADDLVYIQSFGSPALLTFDMSQKLWKWSVKSPVTKRFPLQLFTGFCFEPRLEVAS
ncbi:F-box/kelch-repeat protein At3g61590-like [Zingiber officinale]|uniref:F-box/kelch-repeat protein At3g61590-like n=1 Tax=Zingiber officinale TaxID=94328 RepID=UPI001C4DA8CB|nr:F-box/kelch-repeat protein At3g61590-like [Zingiber officinale]XP_042435819.1 F-box/kelch-repeat protein At3g61590-like [Zingiber officinale]